MWNGIRNRSKMPSVPEIRSTPWWTLMRTLWRPTWLIGATVESTRLFEGSGTIAKSVRQSVSLGSWRMTRCEVIDQTPSDSGSDSDFIEATCHFCTYHICFYIKFLYVKFLLHQVPATMEIVYRACACRAIILRSQADSFALRACWEFHFTMLTLVRAKWFTGSSGKTSLDLSKCFSRIGFWAYGR